MAFHGNADLKIAAFGNNAAHADTLVADHNRGRQGQVGFIQLCRALGSRAEHPDVFKKPETKAKGDDERKAIAKKVSGNNKSTNKSAAEESAGNKRKYYRPGMSTQDVLDRALQDLD